MGGVVFGVGANVHREIMEHSLRTKEFRVNPVVRFQHNKLRECIDEECIDEISQN